MAKVDVFGPEAERLYVMEQCSLAEITSRLGVAERSIRNWKERGGWDDKRRGYLASRQSFHEELYEFARELLASIRLDMADPEKVISPGRLHALLRLLPNLVRVQDYETVASTRKSQENKPSAEEMKANILDVISAVYGVNLDNEKKGA